MAGQGYLQEIVNNSDTQGKNGCKFRWKWNMPHRSHYNGVVESVIKLVRQALNTISNNRAYFEEQCCGEQF